MLDYSDGRGDVMLEPIDDGGEITFNSIYIL